MLAPVEAFELPCDAMQDDSPDSTRTLKGMHGSIDGPSWHDIAAANLADAVPSLLAAGVPLASADRALVCSDPPANLMLQPSWTLERFKSPLRTCALSLAASLGHEAVLAAMLAAGVNPNPEEPHGRLMLHPLAAAAMSSRRIWNEFDQDAATVPESSALAMCRRLLAAGADVLSACGPQYPHWQEGPIWLLCLHSWPVQALLLAALVQRCNLAPDSFRPSFQQCQGFLLLAAQLDDTAAYDTFAATVPAGRAPAEYAALARELVEGACSGSGQRLMLRHMAEQAATAAPGQPASLAAYIATALEHTLQGAAQEGELWEVSMLLEAGVRVSIAAVNAAIVASRPEALALLLPHVQPADRLAVEHQLGTSEPWMVPSRAPQAYACPLLTLLGCSDFEGDEAQPLASMLQVAELLVAGGFRPAVYRDVLVRREGGEQAHIMPLFDPLLHDPTFQAMSQGSGRAVHLAIAHPSWSRHQHHRWPPAFRAAACTFLLATQRASGATSNGTAADDSSSGDGECGCSQVSEVLGRLPEGVLDQVLQLAAYPLSAWAGAGCTSVR